MAVLLTVLTSINELDQALNLPPYRGHPAHSRAMGVDPSFEDVTRCSHTTHAHSALAVAAEASSTKVTSRAVPSRSHHHLLTMVL